MRKILGLSVLVAGSLFAAPIITVTPTLDPDFGLSSASPNFNTWANNVLQQLITGIPAVATGPNVYTPIANGTTLLGNEFIATPFNSWQGVANPGGAFSSELGTALYFSLKIIGDARNQFTLNQLSAQETYLGQLQAPYVAGDFGDGSKSNVFDSHLVGRRNSDGQLTSAADTGNTPLTELYYVGLGFVQGLDLALTGTDQQKIDGTMLEVQQLANKTTQVCYSLGGNSSCGNVLIQAPPAAGVPEPGSMVLIGAGLAGLAIWRRRSA